MTRPSDALGDVGQVVFDSEPATAADNYNQQSNRTMHKAILIAGTQYRAEDKVEYGPKGQTATQIGVIKEFWQDGHFSSGQKDGVAMICPATINSDGKELLEAAGEHRLSQTNLGKLTTATYKKRLEELTKTVVAGVRWESRVDRVKCGQIVPKVEVAFFNRNQQPVGVPKGDKAFVRVTVVMPNKDGSSSKVKFEADIPAGAKTVDIGAQALMKGPAGDGDSVFESAGTYKLTFDVMRSAPPDGSPSKKLATVDYDVQVLAGELHKLDILPFEEGEFEIGKDLPPITLQLLDRAGNVIVADPAEVEIRIEPSLPKHAKLSDAQPHPKIEWDRRLGLKGDDGNLIVERLRIVEGPACKWRFRFYVALGEKEASKCGTIEVQHGPPETFSFKVPPGLTTGKLAEDGGGCEELVLELTNLQSLPTLELDVRDCCGNLCSNLDGWAVLASPALTDCIKVRLSKGVATFPESEASGLRSPLFDAAYASAGSPSGGRARTKKKGAKVIDRCFTAERLPGALFLAGFDLLRPGDALALSINGAPRSVARLRHAHGASSHALARLDLDSLVPVPGSRGLGAESDRELQVPSSPAPPAAAPPRQRPPRPASGRSAPPAAALPPPLRAPAKRAAPAPRGRSAASSRAWSLSRRRPRPSNRAPSSSPIRPPSAPSTLPSSPPTAASSTTGAAGADAGAATAAAWPPIPLDAFLLDGACSPAPSQPCLLRAPRRAGPRAPGRGAPAARGASAR